MEEISWELGYFFFFIVGFQILVQKVWLWFVVWWRGFGMGVISIFLQLLGKQEIFWVQEVKVGS